VRLPEVRDHLVGGGINPTAFYNAEEAWKGYPGEDAEDDDGDQDFRQGEASLTSTQFSYISQRTHSLSRTFCTTLQKYTKLQQRWMHPPDGLFFVILS